MLLAALLAIYLTFPTQDYYWDGISFAQDIEDAASLNPLLLHPNHLVYTPIGYGLFKAVQAIGVNVRSLRVLQIANSILAAIAAVLLFELLLAISSSPYMSVVLTSLFAFSATWWKFSTDANAYIASVLLLLCCFYFLLPDRRSRPLLVATLHTAAMLLHQLSVLFFPVAVVGILQQNAAGSVHERIKAVIKYAAAAFCGTVVIYFCAFYLRHKMANPLTFMDWISSHAPGAAFTFQLWRNALLGLRGTLRLVLAAKASWIFERNPITLTLIVLLVLAVLALLLLFFKTRHELLRFGLRFGPGTLPIVRMSLTWIACYSLFLLVWEPANTFYRLFYLPAIILLLAAVWVEADRRAYRHRGRAALLVAAIALTNFTFSILPHTKPENNPRVAFALRMQPLWKPGTVIYFADFIGNIDDWTMRYFNPQTEWRQLDTNLVLFENAITQARSKETSVWLDTTALKLSEQDREFRARFERIATLGSSYRAGSGYDIRFVEVKQTAR